MLWRSVAIEQTLQDDQYGLMDPQGQLQAIATAKAVGEMLFGKKKGA